MTSAIPACFFYKTKSVISFCLFAASLYKQLKQVKKYKMILNIIFLLSFLQWFFLPDNSDQNSTSVLATLAVLAEATAPFNAQSEYLTTFFFLFSFSLVLKFIFIFWQACFFYIILSNSIETSLFRTAHKIYILLVHIFLLKCIINWRSVKTFAYM